MSSRSHMRNTPRGRSSGVASTSSADLNVTWNPRASRCFPVKFRIWPSSDARPGECSRSRKMPQHDASLTCHLRGDSLACPPCERFGQHDVGLLIDVHDVFDRLGVHRLALRMHPREELPQATEWWRGES